MLRQLISRPDGTPHPDLLPLEKYMLADARRAEAVVGWIRKSPMADVVRQMAQGVITISLHTVAAVPATGASGYFAALLIESGTVPPDNFDRLRLEHWEREEFAKLRNPHDRQILHRFASWTINRQFDEPVRVSGDESLRLTRARQQLTLIIDMLTWIDELGYDLSTVPQRAFDGWLALNGRRGYGATRFVRWARAQGLTRLRSTYGPRGVPTVEISDDVRWTWVRRLMFDETLRLSWRVGGLLALVYGMIGTRIVMIPLSAVDATDANVRLTVGREALVLPDNLGDLVRRQIAAERHRDPAARWLFPGRRPGRHLSARALKTPLEKIGIHIGPGRAIALMTLARDIAPSVLSDLVGVSIEAATRWSNLSSHDWSDYPRLRLSEDASDAGR
ncbi:hypothetical protein [Microbacterium sp. PAMC22086]|uniref:hypothetical protein n=1 Tax=Microbacterium sp. PAMC22086 TaxID=2861281 RepID=UPI001C633CD2|nr:hypothetical protein [Microbacterium sp. PAMC22086]QYG11526.1 hypothetical protein KY497_14925 [Microbacterium sp. PAMC22086]